MKGTGKSVGSGFDVMIVYRSATDRGEKDGGRRRWEMGLLEGENKGESPYPTEKLDFREIEDVKENSEWKEIRNNRFLTGGKRLPKTQKTGKTLRFDYINMKDSVQPRVVNRWEPGDDVLCLKQKGITIYTTPRPPSAQ